MIRLLFHSCRFITFTYILTLMLIVFPKSARAQSPIHPHDPGSLLLFQALGEGLEAADADGLVRRTLQNRALTDLNNARLTGDRVAEAIALEEVGILTGREEGISYLEQAQSIFRSLGRFDDEALTVYRIGDLHEKMGNFQQAFAYYQQAINIVEMHSTPRAKIMKITMWKATCNLHHDLKDYTEAITCYRDLNVLYQQADFVFGSADAHHSMGRAYLAIGDYKKALVNLETSVSLYQQLELNDFGNLVLVDIGRVYLYANNPQKAIEYFEGFLSSNDFPPGSDFYQIVQRAVTQIRAAER